MRSAAKINVQQRTVTGGLRGRRMLLQLSERLF